MDDVRPPVESPFSGVIASVRAGSGKNVRRVDHKLASFKGAALVPPRDSQGHRSENAPNRGDSTPEGKEIPEGRAIRLKQSRQEAADREREQGLSLLRDE